MKSRRTDYVQRASILSALANPARLQIVDSLSRAEKTVGELSTEVGLGLSTVSRHLGILRTAGLVLDRKEGTRVYHKLTAPCVLDFFACVERVLSEGKCMGGRRKPAPGSRC